MTGKVTTAAAATANTTTNPGTASSAANGVPLSAFGASQPASPTRSLHPTTTGATATTASYAPVNANANANATTTTTATTTTSTSSRDPSRPRRKKAKRACFACQRAHLTCGDERPCQRCIKRGLQDQCQDGVRKKAKYLHDAPNEALMPALRRAPPPSAAQPTGNMFAQSAQNVPMLRNGNASGMNPASTAQQSAATNAFLTQPMDFNAIYGRKTAQQQQQQPVNVTGSNMSNAMYFKDGLPAQSANGGSTATSGNGQPVSPTFTLPSSASGTNASASGADTSGAASLNSAFFDPSHPALFNFDIASMNFDNHYGAMEFGILGHITGTAPVGGNGANANGNGNAANANGASTFGANGSVETPQSEGTPASMTTTTTTTNPAAAAHHHHRRSGSTFALTGLDSPGNAGQAYGTLFGDSSSLAPSADWALMGDQTKQNGYGSLGEIQASSVPVSAFSPHAFVIESTRPSSLASGSPADSPRMAALGSTGGQGQGQEGDKGVRRYSSSQQQQQAQQEQKPQSLQKQAQKHAQGQAQTKKSQSQSHVHSHAQAITNPRKRRRSPEELYRSVKKPYSYTAGFHALTAYIHRRFSPRKTLQIAKALSSIRPSLIATNKTLDASDLVFMEKCFQRTLWEYEDFINVVGTPTIVCRRTGEVAAVGKEFCMLTGWRREVLLGEEPNENVNTGGGGRAGAGAWQSREGSAGGAVSANESNGSGNGNGGGNRLRPVLLAELLDDESVIEFYDDFAKLAFGDSRGSIMTTCKLLKYKTREDADTEQQQQQQHDTNGPQQSYGHERNTSNGAKVSANPRWAKGGIADQSGMRQLGGPDGKIECGACWTVKRDVFDIPMLIVMNFLPCI